MHLVYSIVKGRNDRRNLRDPASGWLYDCGPDKGPCEVKF